MGTCTEASTLANAGDISAARNGSIPEVEIRAVTLEALPDTGVGTIGITEEVRRKLGLAIEKPVKIRWKDRDSSV